MTEKWWCVHCLHVHLPCQVCINAVYAKPLIIDL